MRNIPDEFLGALLGGWIGVVTEIWTHPANTVILFILGLVAIALLLGIISGQSFRTAARVIAFLFLILVALLVGGFFRYVPEHQLFDDSQALFFGYLLGGWLLVGLLSSLALSLIPRAGHQEGKEEEV